MNTIKYFADEVKQAEEAARVIDAGMPIEHAEICVAPVAFEPITEEEWEVVATEIPREMALRLREVEADAKHDRRFGLV